VRWKHPYVPNQFCDCSVLHICRSCRHALHKRKERTTGTRLQVQHASATAAAAAFVKPEATDCALALHLHLQQQAQVLHLQQQQAAAAAAAELQQLQMQQQQQQQQMLVPVHSMSSGQVSAKLASLVAAAEQAQAMLAAVRAQVTSQQQLATTPSVCTADALVPDSNSRTASPQDAAASTAAAAADCPAEDAHCAAQAGCFQAPAAAAAAVTAADADAAADVDFEAFLDTLLTSDQPPASSSEQVVPAVSQGLSSGSSDQSTYLPAGLSPFAAAASLAAPPAPCFAGTSTPMTCAQIAPCMSVAASGSLPVGLGGFPSLGPAGGIVTATSTCSTGDVMAPQCGAAAQVGAVQQLESLNAMLQQVQSHVLALMQTSQVSQADTVTYY
jgi:hypothetical protein